MPTDERTLRAILRFALDRQSLQNVRQGTQELEDALDDVERQMQEVRDAADGLATVGETMAVAGAAILAPMAKAVVGVVGATIASQSSRTFKKSLRIKVRTLKALR